MLFYIYIYKHNWTEEEEEEILLAGVIKVISLGL